MIPLVTLCRDVLDWEMSAVKDAESSVLSVMVR